MAEQDLAGTKIETAFGPLVSIPVESQLASLPQVRAEDRQL